MTHRNCDIVMLLDNPFTKDARVKKEVETLVSAGYHMHIIAMGGPGLPETENKGNYTIHRKLDGKLFKPFHLTYTSKMQEWAQFVLSLSPSIVHCHDMYTLPLGHAIKKLDPQIKLLYDSHEYWPGISLLGRVSGVFNKIKNAIVFRYFLFKESLIIKHCDALIGASGFITKSLQAKKTTLPALALYNFPAKMARENSLEKHNDTLTLCICGNLYVDIEVFKNLLQALTETKIKARLILINDREQGKEYHTVLTQQYGNKIEIELWPYPDEEALLNQISSMDGGLQLLDLKSASQKVTSSNRFNLYVNAGVPIICDPTQEAKNVNRVTQSILFLKGHSVSAFKDVLKEFLENKLKLQNTARQHMNKFTWNPDKGLQKFYGGLLTKG